MKKAQPIEPYVSKWNDDLITIHQAKVAIVMTPAQAVTLATTLLIAAETSA